MASQGQLEVAVEKAEGLRRSITVRVPNAEIDREVEVRLKQVGKTAKLKGFRPGMVPLNVVKQFYGEDVRHRLFHALVDESFGEAARREKIRPVGRPNIENSDCTSNHVELEDGKPFTFVATCEVLPEITVKNAKGFSLTRPAVKVTAEDVEQFRSFLWSVAEHVANARKEGFMGLTGERVSDAEEAALERIKAAIGMA